MTRLHRFGAFCLGFTGSTCLALMPDGIVHTGQKLVNPAAVPFFAAVTQPGQPTESSGWAP